jgi:hypothetical protein
MSACAVHALPQIHYVHSQRSQLQRHNCSTSMLLRSPKLIALTVQVSYSALWQQQRRQLQCRYPAAAGTGSAAACRLAVPLLLLICCCIPVEAGPAAVATCCCCCCLCCAALACVIFVSRGEPGVLPEHTSARKSNSTCTNRGVRRATRRYSSKDEESRGHGTVANPLHQSPVTCNLILPPLISNGHIPPLFSNTQLSVSPACPGTDEVVRNGKGWRDEEAQAAPGALLDLRQGTRAVVEADRSTQLGTVIPACTGSTMSNQKPTMIAWHDLPCYHCRIIGCQGNPYTRN